MYHPPDVRWHVLNDTMSQYYLCHHRIFGLNALFLRARDATACLIDGYEGAAIRKFYQDKGFGDFDGNCFPHIVRWAWLRLPNGQIARSAWKEKLKPLEQVRMARNVKVFGPSF